MISVVIISKDEIGLDETLRLVLAQAAELSEPAEVIVVDASVGRLQWIAERHPGVRWIDFAPVPGARVTIPHQRNAGVREALGDIIVFTDAGCQPRPGWLEHLVAALRSRSASVVAGLTTAPAGSPDYYDLALQKRASSEYVEEVPTINLGFDRAAYDAVGGFDETFAYGSDLDFTWRLVDAGYRIKMVSDAIVEHEWGSMRQQLKRAYRYGGGAVRLYRKHPHRRLRVLRDHPLVVIYPAFIIGLTLTFVFPAYPLLLVVPLWRAQHRHPFGVVADHLAYGFGAIAALRDAATGRG